MKRNTPDDVTSSLENSNSCIVNKNKIHRGIQEANEIEEEESVHAGGVENSQGTNNGISVLPPDALVPMVEGGSVDPLKPTSKTSFTLTDEMFSQIPPVVSSLLLGKPKPPRLCVASENEEAIRCRVFSFLNISTVLSRLPRVCKTWRNTTMNPTLWKHIDLTSLRTVINNQIVSHISQQWSLCESLSFFECYDVCDPALTLVAERCPNLKRIDLTGCNLVTNASMISLGKHCHQLESVDITCCRKVTSSGVAGLAKGTPNLKHLKLWGCALVEDEGIMAIARNCENLESLDITWCKSVGEYAFAALSRKCRKMKCLNVTWCERVRDTCIQEMVEWPSLQVLFMDGCGRISNEGLLYLATKCPNLRMVKARFLSKISPHVITQFVNKLPKLTRLDIRNCDMVEREHLVSYGYDFERVATFVEES